MQKVNRYSWNAVINASVPFGIKWQTLIYTGHICSIWSVSVFNIDQAKTLTQVYVGRTA